MPCPDDRICQRCPAAADDDVCLDHERAIAEHGREKVYILAASIDQAHAYARRWVGGALGRAFADAVYLDQPHQLAGVLFTDRVRCVELPGAWRHRQHMRLTWELDRVLAKNGRRRQDTVEVGWP